MREIRTEIEIHSPIKNVWVVLTETSLYPEWNPFLTLIVGPFVVGEKLSVRIQAPGSKAMIVRPMCLERTELRRVRWLGSLGMKGLFDGEHIFELEPAGERTTHFVHRERFSGVLVPLVLALIGGNTRRGFEAMNQKLKERAEALAR